jgi:hypothetical protein
LIPYLPDSGAAIKAGEKNLQVRKVPEARANKASSNALFDLDIDTIVLPLSKYAERSFEEKQRIHRPVRGYVFSDGSRTQAAHHAIAVVRAS